VQWKVAFENSLIKTTFLTWINVCIPIMHSQWPSWLAIQKRSSCQNEILQIRMKPCKFWIENANVRILEKEQQIEKDFTTRTVGLALKWVFKVSPTELGRLNRGGLCPFSGHPSHLTMWLHAVFLVNKSLTKSAWMCLGSKPLGRYLLCAPNQNK
jgi:hypothetical protein